MALTSVGGVIYWVGAWTLLDNHILPHSVYSEIGCIVVGLALFIVLALIYELPFINKLQGWKGWVVFTIRDAIAAVRCDMYLMRLVFGDYDLERTIQFVRFVYLPFYLDPSLFVHFAWIVYNDSVWYLTGKYKCLGIDSSSIEFTIKQYFIYESLHRCTISQY
jgi:hypothetical protein